MNKLKQKEPTLLNLFAIKQITVDFTNLIFSTCCTSWRCNC